MGEKVEVQPESLLNLDDLLQCPVCYEIPTGQIFQCNEGHHVCGRCKIRLDVCPVCRALFFGTRNYAMEELIANFRKLRTFKLGGKVTSGSASSESSTSARDAGSGENENDTGEDEENNPNIQNQITLRAPQACKGLFRCLCCKNGNTERLPSARLLNHLRYFHSPDLIEGQSENGEYLQAWQFSTTPGRLVTAVRVSDMGIFFLIIEMSDERLCAWLTMAASPWVAHEFCYTVTISGNDREAIFSDCVWSVRSCEGSLKKRGHCLIVNGLDAIALTTPAAISGKLSLRRTPSDQLPHQTQPRVVMRVANRGNTHDFQRQDSILQDFQQQGSTLHDFVNSTLDDFQNRVSRVFASLEASVEASVEGNALMISESELRAARIDEPGIMSFINHSPTVESVNESRSVNEQPNAETQPLSRNARRRLRQRLRAALNATQPPATVQQVSPPQAYAQIHVPQSQNGLVVYSIVQEAHVPIPPPVAQVQPTTGPSTSTGPSQNGNQGRNNKKKRRQRR